MLFSNIKCWIKPHEFLQESFCNVLIDKKIASDINVQSLPGYVPKKHVYRIRVNMASKKNLLLTFVFYQQNVLLMKKLGLSKFFFAVHIYKANIFFFSFIIHKFLVKLYTFVLSCISIRCGKIIKSWKQRYRIIASLWMSLVLLPRNLDCGVTMYIQPLKQLSSKLSSQLKKKKKKVKRKTFNKRANKRVNCFIICA